MWRLFTLHGNYKYLKLLPVLIEEYNNKIHRTIKMRPKDVNLKNEKTLLRNVYNYSEVDKRKRKFNVGDKVRISNYKTIFEKKYTANWSAEIFDIYIVQPTNPHTYKLKDYKGEIVKGGFYEHDFQYAKYHDVFMIEKVLKKRNKGSEIFVKWMGFDSSHNSWTKNNIIKL